MAENKVQAPARKVREYVRPYKVSLAIDQAVEPYKNPEDFESYNFADAVASAFDPAGGLDWAEVAEAVSDYLMRVHRVAFFLSSLKDHDVVSGPLARDLAAYLDGHDVKFKVNMPFGEVVFGD